MEPGVRLDWGPVRGASDQCEELGRPPVNVATAAVRQVLAILERASDTWHNGDPAKSGPLHWPVAVDLARRELQQALGTLERRPDEHTQDARAGIVWWNHLTPTQRLHWVRCARSDAPADAWEAFKSGEQRQ
jgi:hypothetical protein